jgi:hypothetical protein
MGLSVGQRITLVRIDDVLAWTHRYQLEVRKLINPGSIDAQAVGWNGGKKRVAVVRQKGKRKEFYLDVGGDDLVFDGWDVPFVVDGEAGGVICGNASFNLVGDVEAIRQCVESRGVFPISDAAKAKILVSPAARHVADDAGTVCLYPEIPTSHGVIEDLRRKLGV